MSSLRAIGGKCRALLAPAKTATVAATKQPKRHSSGDAAKKGILKPVAVSPTLRDFIGSPESSRTDAVKKVWDYIKLHNLQNPANKREIICDEKLKVLFSRKDKVDFLEIAKLLSQHFVKTG